ncbi:G-protein-signaling modulator 2 [Episyrphus balteatus]|uniref:G-protein-signaling modulator 2 n=1 Tax=Episyrphus balteatus TaxID=286459 RepID=UPI0024858ED6|nr:G-protein-signaling modulator 2 [Episyrphus balteatus]
MASLSASAENISCDPQQTTNDASSMCLELALEGERLCKAGDCRAGVAFFLAAVQAGTDDLRTLSAIYSQLGNAYFYLGDYSKAMQYHKLDLTLARSMNDKLGEAKSSGNLGNTLKVMGRFDEAVICCDRHLTLARQLGDRLSEGRALYNLGNVYHAKGKHMGQRNPGDFSDEVKEALTKAVEFYQENLKLMYELGDRGAQGRACGNLGNTYYLLGDFQAAIEHHQERLRIAREFGDKAAERRANSNLGNSHIFLGQFEEAAEHYKRTLSLAIELGEREVEAQSCYSLGNTYTLLREFPTAIEYHHRHLAIAQELGDRVGEARACWSLGNAQSAIGNHEKALHFAESHFSLAKELNDPVGESTAKVNIADLRKLLGLPRLSDDDDHVLVSDAENSTDSENTQVNGNSRMIRVRRQSMEQLDLIKITPDGKRVGQTGAAVGQQVAADGQKKKPNEDDFFEMLSRSQSKRMDDQRCSIKITKKEQMQMQSRKPLTQQNSLTSTSSNLPKEQHEAALKASGSTADIVGSQTAASSQPDDAFLDMLMRCQGSRIEEQRSELPIATITMDTETNDQQQHRQRRPGGASGATVPDEDFFSLIMKVQSGRMEDQRAAISFTPSNRLQSNGGSQTSNNNSQQGPSKPAK